MRTFRVALLLALSLTLTLATAPRAQAEIPPKARAFMLVSGYGAAGGALLGLASMAFGTSPRAIAQGASLGLYAGILFGSYVLISHHQRQTNQGYDRSSPYNDDSGYQDYGEDKSEDSSGGGFFDSSTQRPGERNVLSAGLDYRVMETKKGSTLPPLQINFIRLSF